MIRRTLALALLAACGRSTENGRDGDDGANGIDCWDLDQDGQADATEDVNGDGQVDVLDCQPETDSGTDTGDAPTPYLGSLSLNDEVSAAYFCSLHDRVYGNLFIGPDYDGDTLDALSCLVEVRGELHLDGPDDLTVLELPALKTVTMRLYVQASVLSSLNLPVLESVGGLEIKISYTSNPGTISVPLLASTADWGSVLLEIPGVTALDLGSLTTVGGRLTIAEIDSMANLDGIDAIETVGDRLSLSNNPSLTDIDGLRSIISVGENVEIVENPLLPTAHAQSVADDIDHVGGVVAIIDNG